MAVNDVPSPAKVAPSPAVASTSTPAADSGTATPTMSKQERKALKKQCAKERIEKDDIDRALKELAITLRPRALELIVRDGPVSMDATIQFRRDTDTRKPSAIELYRAVHGGSYIDPQRLVNGADLSHVEVLTLDVAPECMNWWSSLASLPRLRVLRIAENILLEITCTLFQSCFFTPSSVKCYIRIVLPFRKRAKQLEVFASPSGPTFRATLHEVELLVG
ncbi:hypothetical protein PENSPDRAFT_493004 [Peniophora sp. CONT]|nr:hypothetical protein PENSPDRAFT_493004 [Peniophora sp. CONT]